MEVPQSNSDVPKILSSSGASEEKMLQLWGRETGVDTEKSFGVEENKSRSKVIVADRTWSGPHVHILKNLLPMGQDLWIASNQQSTAKVTKCHFQEYIELHGKGDKMLLLWLGYSVL